jgi:peptidoglycan hydrolase-like protein with peptidoglycan-binding domain
VAVVTAVRVGAGDEVGLGDVLVEVSGRPVLALAGKAPGYRDLRPGASGDDVAALQKSLRKLGFATRPDSKGLFGRGTKRAVGELYDRVGHEAPTTGDEAEVKAAQGAVKSAERAVVLARRSLDRLVEEAARAAEEAAAAAAKAEKAAAKAKKAAAKAKESGESGSPSDAAAGDGAAAGDAGGSGAADGGEYAVSDARYDLRLAEEDLAEAREAAGEAERLSGPMVPLSEFVFVPRLPASVLGVAVGVGDPVEGPVVSLSTGKLEVVTRVDPETVGLLAEGMAAEVYVQRLDLAVSGQVESVGEYSDAEDSGPGHDVVIGVGQGLPRDVIGQNVRVTITAASTGEAVLVVPLSAVFSSADGSMGVVVVDPGGGRRRVEVAPGMSGDGFVQVEPVGGAGLGEGERVVVGEEE